MNRRKWYPHILAGIAPLAAMIMSLPQAVLAKTTSEVAQIAIPVTVQINSLSGGGSGVIIDEKIEGTKKTYTVLTANHVVRNASPDYKIRTHTGEAYAVTSVEHLQNNQNDPDLALVKFQSSDEYPIAKLGNSNEAQRGGSISIFGYPTAHVGPFVYSPGELESLNRNGANAYNWLYKAQTQNGMSGGPVFDNEGRVIAIHGRAETFQGQKAFNTGIPINTFMAVAHRKGVTLSATSNRNAASDSYDDDRYAGASHFYCDTSGPDPKTMARNVVTDVSQVLITWKDDASFNWGVDKVNRCQEVSGRFQRAYYDNSLEYLSPGQVNGYPVICAALDEEDSCDRDNILITLQPRTNARDFLRTFLQSSVVVRGEKKDMRILLSDLEDPEI